MRRSSALALLLVALLVALHAQAADADGLLPAERGIALPEFTGDRGDWINSGPLKVDDLAGQVVLLDFWTSECVNCLRTLPWLKHVEQRLGPRGLRLVGVHTPEFERERGAANVARRVRELGIGHPVMVDDRSEYWNALGNRYWPALYLIDKQGRLRALVVGEVHIGDARAARLEAALSELLAEVAPDR